MCKKGRRNGAVLTEEIVLTCEERGGWGWGGGCTGRAAELFTPRESVSGGTGSSVHLNCSHQ